MNKIENRKQLQKMKHGTTVYEWLRRNNPELLDKVLPVTTKFHTFESVEKFVKSNRFKKISDLANSNMSMYNFIRKNNYVDRLCDICNLSRRDVSGTTIKNIKNVAKIYTTRSSFKLNNPSLYNRAISLGILNEVCSHMESGNLLKMKRVVNLDTKEIFRNKHEAANVFNTTIRKITEVCLGKSKTTSGYRWAYCDEEGNILK